MRADDEALVVSDASVWFNAPMTQRVYVPFVLTSLNPRTVNMFDSLREALRAGSAFFHMRPARPAHKFLVMVRDGHICYVGVRVKLTAQRFSEPRMMITCAEKNMTIAYRCVYFRDVATSDGNDEGKSLCGVRAAPERAASESEQSQSQSWHSRERNEHEGIRVAWRKDDEHWPKWYRRRVRQLVLRALQNTPSYALLLTQPGVYTGYMDEHADLSFSAVQHQYPFYFDTWTSDLRAVAQLYDRLVTLVTHISRESALELVDFLARFMREHNLYGMLITTSRAVYRVTYAYIAHDLLSWPSTSTST